MCQDQSARMIIKRGSGVPTIPVSADHRNGDWIATDIYEGEFYQDTDTGLVYQRSGGIILMSGGGKSNLVWEALVTQTGTNAPVLTVINNSLAITASPTYVSTGVYTISGFASNLTGNIKIEASCTNGQSFCSAATSSALLLATTDDSGTNVNDVLLIGSYVKVTKY